MVLRQGVGVYVHLKINTFHQTKEQLCKVYSSLFQRQIMEKKVNKMKPLKQNSQEITFLHHTSQKLKLYHKISNLK